MLPHVPYDAPPEFSALYDGLGLDPRRALYYANVSWLDAFVGAVLAELDQRGLREDTLVVFVSDNGKDAEQELAGVGQGKGTLYEMGFRQPLILNWPGRVPAGVTREDLVSTLDLAPTLLDFAGADALDDGWGTSLRSAVESGAPVGHPRLVSRYRGATASNDGFWVRTPEWRYLAVADGTEELYRIDLDPFEQVNRAPLHPDLVQDFRADFADWQASLVAGRQEVDIAGRITDFLNAPVAGENVELNGRSRAGQRIRLRAPASPRGDFLFESVPLGSYTIRSRRSAAPLVFRSVLGRIPVDLPTGSLDLFLPMRGTQPAAAFAAGSSVLRGTVLDGAGVPVTGAIVRVSGSTARRRVEVTVRTGPDGSYRAESLPPVEYRVVAGTTAPRRSTRTTVTIDPGDDRVLDVTLPG